MRPNLSSSSRDPRCTQCSAGYARLLFNSFLYMANCITTCLQWWKASVVWKCILTTAIQPPPSHSYNHHLHIHIHMQLPSPQTTTTQCKLLECKWSMCVSVWKEEDHQCKLPWVASLPVQGVFAPMAEGLVPPAQVAASDYHHVCKRSTCAGW